MGLTVRGIAMVASDSFAEFFAQLPHGDASALVRRYHRQLLALARTHLAGHAARLVDPEDVVQSVYRTFLAGCAERQFDVNNWASLWGLLARITFRRCVNRTQHLLAARRDPRREVGPHVEHAARSMGARDPSPADAAELADTLSALLDSLKPRDRAAAELFLQGYTLLEIGDRLNCSRRTVIRALDRVREQADRLFSAAG